jgi:integrase
VAQTIAARTSLRLDDIAGRYWQEVGQHHVRSDNTWRMLSLVLECVGKDTLITDITDDHVVKLVAWRRGQRARPDGPLLSPFTVGFRFHDFRHDFATKLLRATGNLKLVQRALNHADIGTTVRYAHVLDHEVAEAMEQVAKSRNRSQTRLREVS